MGTVRAVVDRARPTSCPWAPAPSTCRSGRPRSSASSPPASATGPIGERLFISQNTVANHVRAILAKTGCANRTEATMFAVRHGLVDEG